MRSPYHDVKKVVFSTSRDIIHRKNDSIHCGKDGCGMIFILTVMGLAFLARRYEVVRL